MCIDLCTTSVGPILLVLLLYTTFKCRLYIYNSKCILQDTQII